MKIAPTLSLGSSNQCALMEEPPVTYDGLRIVFANGNWVGLQGLILHDLEGNSIMPTSVVAGGPAKNFSDIAAGQYTYNSGYTGGNAEVHKFFDTNAQWSASGGAGGLTVYLKFAAPRTLSAIYTRFNSPGSYGMPAVSIYDTAGNAVALTASPASASDYASDLPSGLGYKYTVDAKDMTVDFGEVNGSSSYLDGEVTGVCGQFEATISASYNGSGGTWTNLIAAPPIGETVDIWLGSDGSTAAPAFTGSAGDPAAYFEMDATEYFTVKDLVKARALAFGQRTDIAFCPWVLLIGSHFDRETGTENLWGSGFGTSGFGIYTYTGTSGQYHVQAANKLAAEGSTTSIFIADETPFLFFFSWNPVTGDYRLVSNTGSETDNYGATPMNVQDAGIEGRKFMIGATYGASSANKGVGYAGGERIKSFAYGITDGVASTEYAASVIAYYETLHGADYTP